MKAHKTTIIQFINGTATVISNSVICIKQAVYNQVYFTTAYSVTSQSFKIFYLYTVTNIYMYCKEGQTFGKCQFYTTSA